MHQNLFCLQENKHNITKASSSRGSYTVHLCYCSDPDCKTATVDRGVDDSPNS